MLYDQLPLGTPDLYHYSTSAGLLGIVNQKHLWLSHVAYLNDEQEYSYGLNLIQEVMDAEYEPLFRVNAHENSFSPIFSMSLTEEEDLLSQWRGYCPNGGYSFSFDQDQLNTMLLHETPSILSLPRRCLKIGKCIYDKDEQVTYIKNSLAGMMTSPERRPYYLAWERNNAIESQLHVLKNKSFRDGLMGEEKEKKDALEAELALLIKELGPFPVARDPDRDLFHMYDQLRRSIPTIPILLKHPSFKEEREWRIIYHDRHAFNEHPLYGSSIQFREGKSTLIPYIKVPLATGDDRVRLTKVIISPGPQPELAKIACQAFIKRNASWEAVVENSEIPFRNW